MDEFIQTWASRLAIILIFLSACFAHAQISEFPDAKCPNGSHEVGPREIMGQTDRDLLIQNESCHDQGESGTCYAQAATVALNALLKSQKLTHSGAPHSLGDVFESKTSSFHKDLHPFEAFARSGIPAEDGGFPYEFLWNLRHVPLNPQGIALNLRNNFDTYQKFHSTLTNVAQPSRTGFTRRDFTNCRATLQPSASPQMLELLDELDKVFNVDATLNEGPSEQINPPSPQYQINTWCFSDKESIKNKFFEHFHQANPLPLMITLCKKYNSNQCEDSHAVAVTGLQKLNCSDKSTSEYSLEIFNSWGDGKFQSDLNTIIQGVLNAGTLSITEIVSCPKGRICPDRIANENDPNSCALTAYLNMKELENAKRLLKNQKPNLDEVSFLLLKAAEQDRPELSKLLLKTPGIFLNYRDAQGTTPLLAAAQNGNVEIVKDLLSTQSKSPINPNLANENGETPLFTAIKHGHTEVVKTLLHKPWNWMWNRKRIQVDINLPIPTENFSIPKMCLDSGHEALAHFITRRLGSYRHRRLYITALIVAIILEKKEIVQKLLNQDGINTQVTYLDLNAIQWAQIVGNKEIISLISAKTRTSLNHRKTNSRTIVPINED